MRVVTAASVSRPVRDIIDGPIRRGVGLGRGYVDLGGYVLAFTTPECVPCRTMQRPALEELQRRYPGRFELREVDATVAPELAERFGLMTVPSTVVIDARGRVRAINHGLARWPKLAGQLHLNGLRS